MRRDLWVLLQLSELEELPLADFSRFVDDLSSRGLFVEGQSSVFDEELGDEVRQAELESASSFEDSSNFSK